MGRRAQVLVWAARANAAVVAAVTGGRLVPFLLREARPLGAALVLLPIILSCALDIAAARAVSRHFGARRTEARLILVVLCRAVQFAFAFTGLSLATVMLDRVLWGTIATTGAAVGLLVVFTLLTALRGTPEVEADVFTDEELDRSKAYQRRATWPNQVAFVASVGSVLVAVPLAHQWRTTIDRLPWLAGLVVVVVVVHGAANLPLVAMSAYRTLRLDRDFGLAARTAGEWWRDAWREVVANLAVALATAVLLWSVVRVASPRWLVAFLALVLSSVAVYATRGLVAGWIMPMMPASAPVQQLVDELGRASGTSPTPVLIAPMRERRAAANAFVAGLGPLRRIVAYDVLLDLEPRHVEAVLAHELGHVRHHHLRRRLPVLAVANGVVVAALASFGAFRTGTWSAAEYPVVAATAAVVSIYASIFVVRISRRQEQQADEFALDTTRDPAAFASMIRELSVTNLVALTPSALATMRCTHPPVAVRMATATRWAADHPHAVPGASDHRIRR